MLPIGVDEYGNLQYEGTVEPIVIRTTERTNYKKCRRLWKYTSNLYYNKEPVQQSMALLFGIGIHKGAETYYNPATWDLLSFEAKVDAAVGAFHKSLELARIAERDQGKGSLSEERQEEYNEHFTLGEGMLRNYFDYAKVEDEKIGLVPIAVEEKFQIPVYMPGTDVPLFIDNRPVVYQVRIDLVARHEKENNGIYIWDHKTAANIGGDTKFLDLDTQLASYAWAYQVKHGEPVAGVMYNELAKSVPHPPKELKNGSLSQDKRQLTTYELYAKAIDEKGLDPEPYSAMLDFLSTKEQSFFRRTPIFKSQDEIYNQGIYVQYEVEEMAGSPNIYPNPTKMNCNYCAFQIPCNVANESGDEKFVLEDKTLFRQRVGEDMAHASN